MKNILVSGAGGFLGSELVRNLLKNPDVYVIALTRQKERLEGIYGSYANFEVAAEIPTGIDVLIHCAFPANANGVQLAQGLDYIAEMYTQAREQHVAAVIHISSQSVYSQKKDEAATEETIPDLWSKYAVGKYAVEKLTNAFFADIPHTNLRMASLIGPNSDSRISNRFIRQVMERKDIHIVADVQNFGFLDVRDAAKAIEQYAMMDTKRWVEVLNLGSGFSYSLQEVAECVIRVGTEYGYHANVIIGEEIGDTRNSLLNGLMLEELLGWKAEITLEQTIRDAYNHYRDEERR